MPHKTKELWRAYIRTVKECPNRGPKFKLQRRNSMLKHRYGLTVDEVLTLLATQGGRCAMKDCQTTKPGGFKNSWHIDHDHKTGTVRGLLCRKCNIALGYYENNKPRWDSFEAYLSKPPHKNFLEKVS